MGRDIYTSDSSEVVSEMFKALAIKMSNITFMPGPTPSVTKWHKIMKSTIGHLSAVRKEIMSKLETIPIAEQSETMQTLMVTFMHRGNNVTKIISSLEGVHKTRMEKLKLKFDFKDRVGKDAKAITLARIAQAFPEIPMHLCKHFDFKPISSIIPENFPGCMLFTCFANFIPIAETGICDSATIKVLKRALYVHKTYKAVVLTSGKMKENRTTLESCKRYKDIAMSSSKKSKEAGLQLIIQPELKVFINNQLNKSIKLLARKYNKIVDED